MKVCIDGVIQEVEPLENEIEMHTPLSIEDELAEIKLGINNLSDMLSTLIKGSDK